MNENAHHQRRNAAQASGSSVDREDDEVSSSSSGVYPTFRAHNDDVSSSSHSSTFRDRTKSTSGDISNDSEAALDRPVQSGSRPASFHRTAGSSNSNAQGYSAPFHHAPSAPADALPHPNATRPLRTSSTPNPYSAADTTSLLAASATSSSLLSPPSPRSSHSKRKSGDTHVQRAVSDQLHPVNKSGAFSSVFILVIL